MSLTAPVFGLLLALSGPASGQFGEAAGIADAMQPDYLSRDMVIFEQGLELDDTQRVIVEAMFHDYEESFETGLDRMRQRYEEMRPQMQSSDQQRVISMVFTPIEEWTVEKVRLSEQFLENVKVVLSEEQLGLWPAFERRLFREKNLHRGRLSGESLNLFYIVRDMHFDEQTMKLIQPVMDAYDLVLDQALRRRHHAMTSGQADIFQSLVDEDPSKGLAVLRRQTDSHVEVRSVNDKYIEEIAAALPDDLGAQFRLAALELAYPSVYRPTPVAKLFGDAKGLDGLEPAILQAVTDLEAAYLRELEAMNQTLLAKVREYQPVEELERAQRYASRMAGQEFEKTPDPTRELFVKRDDLSRRYARQLQALLTPEQFAQLPGGLRWVSAPAERAATAADPAGLPSSRRRAAVAPPDPDAVPPDE